jgi:YYY domain-containing protein
MVHFDFVSTVCGKATYNGRVMGLSRRLRAIFTNRTFLALGVVLIAALSLRLYSLNWDEHQYLHPDERFISDVITSRIIIQWPPDWDNLTDPDHSLLNPRSDDPSTGLPRDFSYGALPLIVTDLAGSTMSKITGDDWSSYGGKIYQVGRFLSAVFDTLTVLIVFFIGRRVRSDAVGLAAAAVAALTPLAIQLAHFFTTDSWLTFFVSLTLLLSMRAVDSGRRRSFLLCGIGFGLAMATKGSVFTLAGVVAVALFYAAWMRRDQFESWLETAAWIAERGCLAALGALGAFAIFEPYALVRPATYVDQIRNQSDIIRGTFDVPFTRQYIGTTPVLYQIEQIVRWGYGPVAGAMIALGTVLLVRALFKTTNSAVFMLLAWLAGYGLVIAIPETKFLRYLAPLIPVFAVLAGLGIVSIRDWLARRNWQAVARIAPAALLIGVGLWTAAFMHIYAQTNPRIEASQWIYTNVPAGSVLSSEYWDDSLPLDLSAALNPGAYGYTWTSFDMYANGETSADTANTIYNNISSVDYIVISSNRIIESVTSSPWRYPVQIEYYDLLREGKLGFTLVAEFENDPEFLGVSINDQSADESFINYDHPRVLVYQKTSALAKADYDSLMATAVAQPVSNTRHEPADTLMLDEPVSQLPVVNDGRWSESWTDNSLVALVWWIVFLLILQAAGLPVAMFAFRRFSDRGWAFARLLTLLIAGWFVWILASIEAIEFRVVWCWIAIAILLLPWLFWRKSMVKRARTMWADRAIRRSIAGGEIVFWSVFALFLLFRFMNPDSWQPYWGGEKAMEFAHINAILRSAHFPPYDPWFSGGFINYYYYGMYLVAFCFKATGIPAEIAFNLAEPTFIAFLALAAYGLSATLGRLITRNRLAAPIVGACGAIVLVLFGNLVAAAKIVQALPDRANPDFQNWFWGASRVITQTTPTGQIAQQISEFPYFTGLYADLHAHVVALPISVLVLSLGLSLALEARQVQVGLNRRNLALLAPFTGVLLLAALVVGVLYPTNTWDFFTYAAFIVASLFATFRFFRWPARLIVTGIVGGLTVGLGYLLYLPFHLHFVALFSSVKQSSQKTDPWQFSQHFGGIFLLALLGLIALTWTRFTPNRYAVTPTLAVRIVFMLLIMLGVLSWTDDISAKFMAVLLILTVSGLALATGAWWQVRGERPFGFIWNRHIVLVGAVLSVGMTLDNRLVLGLCIALAVMSVALWLGFNGVAEKHLALMATAGFAIPGAVEIVYVVDDLDNSPWERMNTMFKLYNQAWVMLAICGGVLLGWLIWEGVRRPMIANLRIPFLRFSPTTLLLAGAAIAIASFAYPITATMPRLDERFEQGQGNHTLNAFDWMNYASWTSATGHTFTMQDDLAAIEWFNDNVSGTPVIAEAMLGPYRGDGSRFSIATGFPDVLGWDRHESQQRYVSEISKRSQDLRRLYRSSDPAEKMEILEQYGVTYVIVGDIERYGIVSDAPGDQFASEAGIDAFEQMIGEGLEIAFQQGNTTVYQVVPSEAPTSGGSS